MYQCDFRLINRETGEREGSSISLVQKTDYGSWERSDLRGLLPSELIEGMMRENERDYFLVVY